MNYSLNSRYNALHSIRDRGYTATDYTASSVLGTWLAARSVLVGGVGFGLAGFGFWPLVGLWLLALLLRVRGGSATNTGNILGNFCLVSLFLSFFPAFFLSYSSLAR